MPLPGEGGDDTPVGMQPAPAAQIPAQDAAAAEFQLWDEEEIKEHLRRVLPEHQRSEVDDVLEAMREVFGNVTEIATVVAEKRRDELTRRAALSDSDKENWEVGEAEGSGPDLRGLNVQGLKVTGLNLDGADCRGACFQEANLSVCNLNKARLR